MAGTYTYNASQVSVVFFNIPVNAGYADGEFLTIAQEANDFDYIVGTDGTVGRNATNNAVAVLQLKLLQVSPTNDLLSAVRLAGLANNLTGVGPFMVKDRLGTSLYQGLHTWIAKPPDVSFDRGVKERVWTFHCSDLVRYDGSNLPL